VTRFSGILQELIDRAMVGEIADVDFIMGHLTCDSDFAMTRYVDFALSNIKNDSGVERIRYYLFNGSLIQRNYASLYLNCIGDWESVKEAFRRGLIDEIQAFAR